MVSTRLIRKIELGPRQMTFGFDDGASGHMDLVLAFIEKQYRANGPVAIESLMDPEVPPFPLEPREILQAVFWLAEEMKIHLYAAERAISPFQAKQALLDNPDTRLDIATNQLVDSRRFEQAKALAEKYWPALPKDPDQYTFSRVLINELTSWQALLTTYQPHAEKPNFPGSPLIRNSLVLINRLLENKDSYSLILALIKYQSKIPELSDNVKILINFFTHKLSFWTTFTEQMEDFRKNQDTIGENREMYAVYRKLNNILKASHPFEMVRKAELMLPELESFHKKIELKKTEQMRKESLDQTDKMIKKLSTLFDTFDTGDDFRNDTLHAFRKMRKRMAAADSREEIAIRFNDLKDQFVDIIETL